jgi:glycolate oxidase iron-sulfur subunit
MNASGCGVTVKDYGHALAHDPDYAEKARRVSALTRDLSELLPDLVGALKPKLRKNRPAQAGLPPAVHAAARPAAAWRRRAAPGRAGLRGAAGAGREPPVLRQRRHLQRAAARAGHAAARPQAHPAGPLQAKAIVRAARARRSANIGCIQHLQSGTPTPVRHWVEVLDEALA